MPDESQRGLQPPVPDLIGARAAAGLSQAALAKELGWAQGKVSRIETGVTPVKATDAAAWMTACKAPAEEVARAMDAAVQARTWAVGGSAADRQEQYRRREDAATRVVAFQPIILPFLTQTDEYAAAILGYFYPPQDIPEAVAKRIMRARRLQSRTDVEVVAVVHEDALRRRVVPDHVLRRQLDRLGEMIDDPALKHMTIAVIPSGRPEPRVPSTSFVLLEGEEPTVLIEYMTGDIPTDAPNEVADYRAAADAWLSVAATGDEAQQIIAKVRSEIDAFG